MSYISKSCPSTLLLLLFDFTLVIVVQVQTKDWYMFKNQYQRVIDNKGSQICLGRPPTNQRRHQPIFPENSIGNCSKYVRDLEVMLIHVDSFIHAEFHECVQHIFKNIDIAHVLYPIFQEEIQMCQRP